MKTFALTFALIGFAAGCSKDDAADTSGPTESSDTGENEVVDPVSDAPGCGTPSVSCNAFIGPLWTGQEETSCASSSEQAEAQDLPAMEFYPEGCPDGAFSECSDQFGMDEDEEPVVGAEYTTYYYGAMSADGAASDCETKGGTYLAY